VLRLDVVEGVAARPIVPRLPHRGTFVHPADRRRAETDAGRGSV
jgi:hypothetical protein